ncbi:hypothetical protein BDR22DRAFT_550187 [Usnea florida]
MRVSRDSTDDSHRLVAWLGWGRNLGVRHAPKKNLPRRSIYGPRDIFIYITPRLHRRHRLPVLLLKPCAHLLERQSHASLPHKYFLSQWKFLWSPCLDERPETASGCLSRGKQCSHLLDSSRAPWFLSLCRYKERSSDPSTDSDAIFASQGSRWRYLCAASNWTFGIIDLSWFIRSLYGARRSTCLHFGGGINEDLNIPGTPGVVNLKHTC